MNLYISILYLNVTSDCSRHSIGTRSYNRATKISNIVKVERKLNLRSSDLKIHLDCIAFLIKEGGRSHIKNLKGRGEI